MGKVIINKCPYCSGEKFLLAYSMGFSKLYVKGYPLGKKVEHKICVRCGSIVHSKIYGLKKPTD